MEVIHTYPADAVYCDTEADLMAVDGDNWEFGGGSLAWRDGQWVFQCYGTKITVKALVTIDGQAYAPGTLLTVDKNLE